MSKNSVSRGSTNGAVGSEIKFAGNDKEKMYEPKHRRKLIRVLTVIAYLFSVSLAAIMLSLFYVFIYNPGKLSGENSQDQSLSQKHQDHQTTQGSVDLMNETKLNLEQEEPRALPVKELSNTFWSDTKDLPDDESHFNLSMTSGKENKTIFKKMMKLLKAE